MSRTLWGVSAVLMLLLGASPGDAQGMVGGVGVSAYTEVGAKVTLREVGVRAHLSRGVARTDLTLVFDHELKSPAQMTVNLVIARDAVITGYSYWFKGEQIDAKLLDNDRAWEIYRAVTSRGRDPAIMEQWGETNYHFQIYPVEPAKELKMVIHTVSPWESDEDSYYYRPPQPFQGTRLQKYSAEVHLRDLGLEQIRDNFIGRFKVGSDGPMFRFDAENWEPNKDWRIRIGRHQGELDVLAGGGRSGGRRGFFYLLIAPGRRIGPARLRLSGVPTSLVMPLATGGLERGFPWLVTGRYRGSGTLSVELRPRSGRSLRTRIALTDRVTPNSPATKFWASDYIKRLSNSSDAHQFSQTGPSRRRTAVIRTSQRFGVTSPYTAWLAIPKSELEVYRKMLEDPEYQKQISANRAQTNARATRGGDPLIRIHTTPDIRQVTAVLPTGEAIPLARKPGNNWEARFDIPWATAEGSYQVLVLLQSENGSRKSVALEYTVDKTAASGAARLEGGRLRVVASDDVVRVLARTEDGLRTELTRGAGSSFSAELTAAGPVEITLIDRAHNVTVFYTDPR